ncbi:uncharacterized protein LOC114256322 [Camellia sinensis]|uniref:uncharacterized protein LOC114256322 n=1 Tax=Camellia sinensis TaxID=4442 RepID=UPI00103647B6|nr:uncharacterized protein LOC114256322 [Camellia sinensis]
MPQLPVAYIQGRVFEVQQAQLNLPHSSNQGPVHSLWLPPSGWIKINVDDSVLTSKGFVCQPARGIVRSENEKWTASFWHQVGNAPILVVELWTIWLGLQLGWSIGFRKILVEFDCVDAIHMINSASAMNLHFNLCQAIRDWLPVIGFVNFVSSGVKRTSVDFLAKNAFHQLT